MRPIASALAATLVASFLAGTPVGAHSFQPAAALSLAQAEHAAVDLKQGMTSEEVQKLLGQPRRTALKSDGGFPNRPSQGTLQWTYSWTSSSAQGNLRIEFAAKAADQWYVNSWEWASY